MGFKEECYHFHDTHGVIQDNKYVCNEVFQWVISSNLRYSYNIETQRCGLSNDKSICDAPTLEQAHKFIISKGLLIVPYSKSFESWQYRLCKKGNNFLDSVLYEDYTSYEEALSDGITECIKILEQNE